MAHSSIALRLRQLANDSNNPHQRAELADISERVEDIMAKIGQARVHGLRLEGDLREVVNMDLQLDPYFGIRAERERRLTQVLERLDKQRICSTARSDLADGLEEAATSAGNRGPLPARLNMCADGMREAMFCLLLLREFVKADPEMRRCAAQGLVALGYQFPTTGE